ncbi:MAG TPA: SBBP repeat-containing protein [Candidatus Angelobacter sp.]|nr:SBBP repeat-containing protein [Candidatus Angelobacter sp.]
MSFEPNRGQTNRRVKFLSRADNRTLWLTSNEAVLAVGRPLRPDGPDTKKAAAVKENQAAPAVLQMKFVGANTSPMIEGEARQPGTVNYFAGKPDEWRTKIPTYARVRYRSLYRGIDLVFYGNNRELEYDLVVAPGADPGRIRFALQGAESMWIDEEGNLVLATQAGDVIQQRPKVYQRSGATLKPVSGEYVITAKNEVGFRLGSYDPKSTVVIDPVLKYSSFLGGSGLDSGRGIAVDSSKRAVVTGLTCSLNFPRTTGPKSFQGCAAFVSKFDFTGSHLIFSTFVGESNFEFFDVGGMALDSAGNAYITGITENRNFPTTAGAFETELGPGDPFAAFVTKISANGSELVYSTFLGGGIHDEGHAIAVDANGNAYVTGETHDPGFPTTAGAFQPHCKLFDVSCNAAFVTKLNSNGSKLVYSTFLGGSSNGVQAGRGIAVDSDGNAFVTGDTDASDFPTTAGSAQPVFGGGASDAFVAEISSSGSHLIYSTYLGGTGIGVAGTGFDSGSAIALDSLGNAYVTGTTGSANFPVKNAFLAQCIFQVHFCVDSFVTKLNASGRLVYSTYLSVGGGSGIAVTPGGEAYVTGTTTSAGFPTTQTAFQRVLGGGAIAFGLGANDIFLTKFTPAGKLIYSTYFGGSGDELGGAVALDRDTNAYLTGTAGSTLPVTPGAFQQKFAGGESDAFVAKVVALCALNTVNRTVTICAPGNGSTVKSPVNIVAGTTDVTPVKLTQVYLDGKKIYETPLSAINVNLPIAGGTHRLTVQGLDTAGVFFKKPISINVSPH